MEDDLRKQYQELSFLCLNYDPCGPSGQEEVNQLLKKYHLTHIEDPFMVTNELLKMLDQCEGQIKELERYRPISSHKLH